MCFLVCWWWESWIYPGIYVGHHTDCFINDASSHYTELEMETESEHMLGMGGIAGGSFFSALFGCQPGGGYPCLFYCRECWVTARIILQHHTPSEVLTGFGGFICTARVAPYCQYLISNFLIIIINPKLSIMNFPEELSIPLSTNGRCGRWSCLHWYNRTCTEPKEEILRL